MPTRTIEFRKFHAEQKAIYKAVRNERRSVLRCGRRFGKTTMLEDMAGNWALPPIIDPSKPGLKVGWFSPSYKLLLPSYKRILQTIRPMVANASKVDALIELQGGGLIEFWTLTDEDAGRSRSYDVAIVDEGSLVKKGLKDIWQKSIEPTLLDRRGIGIMAGTPKGIDPDNFFYEACSDKRPLPEGLGWTEFHAPTSANPMLDPIGVANLVNEYPPLVYQQEFLAEFVDWSGASFFERDKLLDNGQPVPWPEKCDAVFAVMDTAVKDKKEHDGTGVTYVALNQNYGTPVTFLDWDLIQIEGAMLESWVPSVTEKLEHMARVCGARAGNIGLFIEDKASGQVLLQILQKRPEFQVHAIDSKLTAVGKEERAISVSGYVYRGNVKWSQTAFDKTTNFKGQTRNHLTQQVLGFRIGAKEGTADDLLDCFCYSIAIALGDSEGF